MLLAIAAYVLGLAVLAISGRELRHWRVVLPALLGMNVLVVLPFMLWLHVGITLQLAQISAIVLATLTAVVLAGSVHRERPLLGGPASPPSA